VLETGSGAGCGVRLAVAGGVGRLAVEGGGDLTMAEGDSLRVIRVKAATLLGATLRSPT